MLLRVSSLLIIFFFFWSNNIYTQIDKEDEKYFVDLIEKYDVPGISIAVVEDYEISYVKAFGVKNSKTGEEATENTLFQAASLSKSLTSALFLRYAQKGKMDLDLPINTYLKGWQIEGYKKDQKNAPTARQLLSHTGGTNLSGYLGYRRSRKNIPTNEMALLGKKGTYLWEPQIKTKFQPNEGFRYSGGGFSVLQKAISDHSGKAFYTLMKEEVFIPCGMDASFIELTQIDQYAEKLSTGHKKNAKPVKGDFYLYPQSAAAGVWTTPRDLAKFLIQIMLSVKGDNPNSDTFLSREKMKELTTFPTLNNGGKSYYGLGFTLTSEDNGKVEIIRHSGSNWGFSCVMYANLINGKAVIVMINRHKMALWPFTDRIMEKINFKN